MGEIQRQRIKGVYGEIAGILKGIPKDKDSFVVYRQVGDQFNSAIDELNDVSGTNYSRFKMLQTDLFNDLAYQGPVARGKIGGLVSRLEEEHDFGARRATSQSSPVVVTVNNNNQITISVTPIQQIIDNTDDEALKQELDELKEVLSTSKDPQQASSLLNKIQQKSWDVFMKVLPIVLEQLGRRHGV